jgi:integrase
MNTLSLATGMRKGELLGLRWWDVDWDHDTVHVRQTQGVVRGKTYLKPTPKTAAGKRTITVPRSVMDQLKAHRVTQLAAGHWSKTGLVFTSATGTAINPRNLSRQCDVLIALAITGGVAHGVDSFHAPTVGQLGGAVKVWWVNWWGG